MAEKKRYTGTMLKKETRMLIRKMQKRRKVLRSTGRTDITVPTVNDLIYYALSKVNNAEAAEHDSFITQTVIRDDIVKFFKKHSGDNEITINKYGTTWIRLGERSRLFVEEHQYYPNTSILIMHLNTLAMEIYLDHHNKIRPVIYDIYDDSKEGKKTREKIIYDKVTSEAWKFFKKHK